MLISEADNLPLKLHRDRRDTTYRTAWFLVALLVAAFYFWCAQSGYQRFVWDRDLDGYYDLLGRAFLGGKLYLPVEPRPELLALPDPWDATANLPYRLHDAVLYQKHYYLYHGAAPALLLFAPWRLLTRHDLPENFAVFLFCFGGYLLLCELLILVLSFLPYRASPSLFTLFLLVFGLGESLPFLLQRAMVYEVVIAAGFFFLSCGFFSFFKVLTHSRLPSLWTALCGLSFGLAIGCRPHLGLAAIPVFVLLFIHPDRGSIVPQSLLRKEVFAYVLPFMACCLALASYNFVRFGNPFEFGLRYQLGRPDYLNLHLSSVNVPLGIYYLLLCLPLLEPVFPFFRFSLHPHSLPARYFLEPIAGITSLCPLTILGVTAPLFLKLVRNERPVSTLILAMYLYSGACVLFIAALGLSSQRFEVDFQPFLLFVGCVLVAVFLGHLQGFKRTLAMAAITILVVYSIAANLALAVQGPYDQFVQVNPGLYCKVARWFSPVERSRPLLNPKLRLEGYFDFAGSCWPETQPLISLGEFGSHYALLAECLPNHRLRLISGSGPSTDVQTIEVHFERSGLNSIGIEFTPENRVMAVFWNGVVVLKQPLPFLVTARSQIYFGMGPAFGNKTMFNGRIVVFQESDSNKFRNRQ